MEPKVIDHATGLDADEIEKGKVWAILSYASMIIGLPLFVAPLLMRDNEFALQHAKWAGACFIGFVATVFGGAVLTSLISFFTCGILAPTVSLSLLGFLFFIPAVQGVAGAVNGKLDEPWGAGELSELLFDELQMKVDVDDPDVDLD